MAHEIGHAMGMSHDDGTPRTPCYGGVMTRGLGFDIWSVCSKEQLKGFYNEIVSSSEWSWCLAEVEGLNHL